MSDDDTAPAEPEPTPPAPEPPPTPQPEPDPATDPGPLESEIQERDLDPGQIRTAETTKGDLDLVEPAD